ncbi:MAG: hypothetical protein JRD69_04650 [Deltaproteobacteria bacterium]|nr:hypothetical protein [Deltaproteobacteria bacterium]
MNKLFLIFFVILGAADFIYGLYIGDRISLLIGGVMVFIGFSVIRRDKKKEKDSR